MSATFSPPVTVNVDASGKLVITPVTPPPPPALVADFTFAPIAPSTANSVLFNAAASGGNPPYAYAWDFGDGSTGTGLSTSHTFAVGSFNVALTVTDATGTKVVAIHSVVVTLPPVILTADFAFVPTAPLVGQAVSFTATAAGGTGPYTYAWNFGDGSAGTGLLSSHSFAAAATFNVTLTVTDSIGNKAVAVHSIIVKPQPVSLLDAFTFAPVNPLIGSPVTFNGSASGGTAPYTYAWAFGDGSTGIGQVVSHTFTIAGTFNATLTVTDAAANVAIATHAVVVTLPLPSPTKLTLNWEGFDYDGGGENILSLNGKVVGSFPSADTPANGQSWKPFSLDITNSVLQGSNMLVFSHTPWDCAVNDNVRNLLIVDQNGSIIFSDPTERIVNCTTSTSYAFNIGGPPPPPPPPGSQQPTLSITSAPNPSTPGAAVTITGKLALSTGTGLGAQTVTLQQSVDQGVTWTPLGTGVTATDGTYSFTQIFATAGSYQLRTQFAGA